MNELKRKYYQTELIRMRRGNSGGVFINAKPLYVISLIESIERRILIENKIQYPSPKIEKVYLEVCKKREFDISLTQGVVYFYQ